ncbi:MAG: YbaB/EbfC family nucleoid-associated protein [Myxococcales bacterium]|nr:YbaB/EbfC family nucleoid-associated protein [Myxococcales bacterium]
MKFRGGMGELMRQASRMQRRIEQRREELKAEEFEAGAGNDRVKAKANGAAELISVVIDPELFASEGLEMTQDLVVAACNAALEQARTHVDAEIEKVSGGLKIPGVG